MTTKKARTKKTRTKKTRTKSKGEIPHLREVKYDCCSDCQHMTGFLEDGNCFCKLYGLDLRIYNTSYVVCDDFQKPENPYDEVVV